MRAHIVENGVITNTIIVDSLDALPNLVDASIGGNIGDSIVGGAVVPRAPLPPVVPKEVSRRQGLQMLRKESITEAMVEAKIIELIPEGINRDLAMIEFRTSQVFERYRPLTVMLGAAFGLNMDALFISGAAL